MRGIIPRSDWTFGPQSSSIGPAVKSFFSFYRLSFFIIDKKQAWSGAAECAIYFFPFLSFLMKRFPFGFKREGDFFFPQDFILLSVGRKVV